MELLSPFLWVTEAKYAMQNHLVHKSMPLIDVQMQAVGPSVSGEIHRDHGDVVVLCVREHVVAREPSNVVREPMEEDQHPVSVNVSDG
eukprot:2118542-Rhodomonas_salina.3